MANRRIGVFISNASSSYQKPMIAGIGEAALENDTDVLVFTSFSEENSWKEYLKGEVHIYSLPDTKTLDGIIVIPDTLKFSCIDSDFTKKLESQYHCPLVYVDYESPIYPCIFNNDGKQIQKLVEHFIIEHEYSDIAYVSGPKGHPIAENRIKCFKKAMASFNLEVSDDHIYYGDFWYNKGSAITEQMIQNGMPRAILCANDQMALSIIDSLENRGYLIPEDVAIAGFDSESGGITKYHSITSSELDTRTTGATAFYALYKLITDKDPIMNLQEEDIPLYLTDSCGCPQNNLQNPTSYLEEQHMTYSENTDYGMLCEKLISSKTLNDFMWELDWHTGTVATFDSFAICLNTDWLEDTDELKGGTNYHFSDMMLVPYIRNDNTTSVLTQRSFLTKQLIPDQIYDESPSMYFLNPLHFLGRSFGYTIIGFHNRTGNHLSLFRAWLNTVNASLESLRRLLTQQDEAEKNVQLAKDVIRTQEQVILAFAEISESKSGETGRHVKRVSEYSRILAQGMGYSVEDVEKIRLASMMHDIGKLLIPLEILEKPGPLTEQEFDLVRTHVTLGEKLLKNAPGDIMNYAKIIALEHHEHWDGTGYLGKKGTEINLMSSIVAVADVFDALVSKRSYKTNWTIEEASSYIYKYKGSYFRPDVVTIFKLRYEDIREIVLNNPDT